jgi:PhnB protein
MGLSVHLTYAGNCEAAFEFYRRCFAGVLETTMTLRRYADSAMATQVPADWQTKLVHASLSINEATIAGTDLLFADYVAPKGFFILLDIKQPLDAERVFAALGTHGTISMPIQKTFWAERFGVLVDQFGIPWEINC